MNKIKKINELVKIVNRQKKLGKKVGYITGSFDVLHQGHTDFLNFVRARVDSLVVGLNSDKSIKLTKGDNWPVNPIAARSEVVSNLESVDYVFDLENNYKLTIKEEAEYENKVALTIDPNIIAVATRADPGWKEKEYQAELLGAGFLRYDSWGSYSLSEI